MKNFSKTIASVGLSLLAIAAFGQSAIKVAPPKLTKRTMSSSLKFISSPKSVHGRLATPGTTQGLIDYVNGDAVISGGSIIPWGPAQYINSKYTLADTTYSPYLTNAANSNLVTVATVTYDTLWDFYSQQMISNVTPGSVAVDTIWAFMAYDNFSGVADTLVFSVNSVTSGGFPASSPTVYGTYSVILTPGNTSQYGLNYNNYDSIQLAYFVPTTPISIPANATHGWNFSINMSVIGSKMDTIGLYYFSQASACTAGSITDAYTTMGVRDGYQNPSVNSFVTGLTWFNDAANHGNNSVMTWPTYTGTYAGLCINSGMYYWYDQVYSGCTDTAYFPEQDLGLLASIDYNNTTGINNIATSGISIGQNYPNPFNKTTQIAYTLTKSSDVTFSVYDMTGRVIINSVYTNSAAGDHVINLSANTFSPGVYFYSFNVNGSTITKKMVITE